MAIQSEYKIHHTICIVLLSLNPYMSSKAKDQSVALLDVGWGETVSNLALPDCFQDEIFFKVAQNWFLSPIHSTTICCTYVLQLMHS